METNGTDWQGRARREAAAILAGIDHDGILARGGIYDSLVNMLAIAWMQGVNYGTHITLHGVEAGFEKLRAEL